MAAAALFLFGHLLWTMAKSSISQVAEENANHDAQAKEYRA
jgi:hypothetical protein